MNCSTISEAAAALRGGEVTSVALTQAALAAADAHDELLGVFLRRFDETALEAAARADAELAAGVDRGPLHGIPLGVKDILATVEAPATAQSLVLDPAWSKQIADAPVVARLRAAGAVIVGKTTTFEFAIGFPDPDKPFPIPRNPWDPARTPGGSSAGTGAGVPMGMFLGGLGTDTGGSVRMPAAFCGITGLKATFGRVPKSGCAPLAYTLDGIGPMARSARDCALMLAVMAGADPTDPYSSARPVDDYLGGLTGDLSGLRIGVDTASWAGGDVDPSWPDLLSGALAVLSECGATVVDVVLPLYAELVTAQSVTMAAESAAYHLPDLPGRWPDYGVGARAYFGGGLTLGATDYVQAQRVRRVGQKAMAELFAQCDLVINPASTMPAFVIADTDPVRPFATLRGLHTQYWNSVGNPSMSVPIGFSAEGMPFGMQISGRPFDEASVLRAGDAYQTRTDWHLRRPSAAALSGANLPRHAAPPVRRQDVPLADARLAAVRHLLTGARVNPDEAEMRAIAEGFDQLRPAVGALYDIPAVRYEDPALGFSALL
ncbi:amidase [Nonomuraea sp. H19]|uniref:amidase n=1 Tax=Nonomuraea sp. H19 TaxID=3452206 RepID=UPI003F8A674A